MHALHCGMFIWMYHVENDWGNSKKAKVTRVKSGSESAGMWKSMGQMNLFRSSTYKYFLICSHFCERCHKRNGHRSLFHAISPLTCATLCAAQHNNVWAELPKQRVASHLKVLLFYLSLFLVLLGIQTAHFSKSHIFWWAATFVVFTGVQPKFNRNTSVYMFTCSTTEPLLCVYWQHIKTLPWQYLCTKPVDSVSSRHRNAFAFSATYWRMWQSKLKIHKTSLWWFEIEKMLVAVIGVLPVIRVSVMWSQF